MLVRQSERLARRENSKALRQVLRRGAHISQNYDWHRFGLVRRRGIGRRFRRSSGKLKRIFLLPRSRFSTSFPFLGSLFSRSDRDRPLIFPLLFSAIPPFVPLAFGDTAQMPVVLFLA